uniref:Uncharacterized protein n=1 Tax=Timema monikensis TaxID=170555 RepID=A0A7R9EHB8_9NEOP|nr:unnamed protein product [Timema monikensis]
MTTEIAKTGLYFDELNKIRVLEPEVSRQTNQLKGECKEFVEIFLLERLQVHPAIIQVGHNGPPSIVDGKIVNIATHS